MTASRPPANMGYKLRLRIRVIRDDGMTALGPGKADLLDAIARTGSIRAAAAELQMSYMRAWTLVKTMNDAFPSPLVETKRGGARNGGAHLTPRGQRVLRLYRKIEEKAHRAIDSLWEKMREEL